MRAVAVVADGAVLLVEASPRHTGADQHGPPVRTEVKHQTHTWRWYAPTASAPTSYGWHDAGVADDEIEITPEFEADMRELAGRHITRGFPLGAQAMQKDIRRIKETQQQKKNG